MTPEDRTKALEIATEMIAKFEGCKLRAYQDSVGVWTIAYGHTKNVTRGLVITQAEADRLLNEEVDSFMSGVEAHLKVDPTANQLAAMTSFAYNVGLHNFAHSSLLRHFNNREIPEAKREFGKWNHAGHKVLAGLTIRRHKEATVFGSMTA